MKQPEHSKRMKGKKNPMYGCRLTEDEKRKRSESIKTSKKYQTGLKNRKHGMAIEVVEMKNDKVIARWNSIKELAIELGVHKSNLRRWLYQNLLVNGRKFILQK